MRKPSLEAVSEARKNPGGWVYEVVGRFAPDDAVPPESISGAWKVDESGTIVGEFIPNPRFGIPDTIAEK